MRHIMWEKFEGSMKEAISVVITLRSCKLWSLRADV